MNHARSPKKSSQVLCCVIATNQNNAFCSHRDSVGDGLRVYQQPKDFKTFINMTTDRDDKGWATRKLADELKRNTKPHPHLRSLSTVFIGFCL